jgi:hypothetical protein
MKEYFLSLFVCVVIFSAVCDALPASVRPLGPVDVSGTASEVRWVPEKKLKGIPGMSGSAGMDRTVEAHFLVTLTDFEGVDSKTATAMTRYLDRSAMRDHRGEQKPSFILLKINHNDKDYLRKGMNIKVSGYTVRGDEGGTWSYYRKVDILNQLSRGDSIERYLETSIESPNKHHKAIFAEGKDYNLRAETLLKDTQQKARIYYNVK